MMAKGDNERASLIFFAVVVGGLLIAGVVHNYEPSPYQAAVKHGRTHPPAEVLADVQLDWGRVLMLKDTEGYWCALAMWRGLSWGFPTYIRTKDDLDEPLTTIGWVSYKNVDRGFEGTVLGIRVRDPEIAFISAGQKSAHPKKEPVPEDGVVLLKWPEEALTLRELEPTAHSSKGELLYEYRFPCNVNSVRADDLKWYPPCSESKREK